MPKPTKPQRSPKGEALGVKKAPGPQPGNNAWGIGERCVAISLSAPQSVHAALKDPVFKAWIGAEVRRREKENKG